MTFADIFMLTMLAICGISSVVCIVMAIRADRQCSDLADISETDAEADTGLEGYDRHIRNVDYHVNLLATRMIQYEKAASCEAVLDRGSYRMVIGRTVVRGRYGIGLNEHRRYIHE